MLTVARALRLNSESAPELPRIPALEAVYRKGVVPRRGMVMMITGRSGTQKSGLALWLSVNWNVPTLYCSADMSPFTATTRVASMLTRRTTEEVESAMREDSAKVLGAVKHVPITFSFDSPITWRGLEYELNSYVELHGHYPELIVIDNLMDVDGADEYQGLMDAMQDLTSLARATGSAVLIMHHASDKTQDARNDPWSPPSRSEIKHGLSEKPELTLSVALNPHSGRYAVACIKQRMGPSDPTAQDYAVLQAIPEQTRFEPFDIHRDVYSYS